MVKSVEKQIKEKKKDKDNKKELAARKLIQILALNPKIPVSIQDKVREVTSQKDALEHSLSWINQIISVLGKVPHIPSIGAKIGAKLGKTVKDKVKDKKAKGGIVQKFSKGGTVERPRGVGIAKRGYGRVMR